MMLQSEPDSNSAKESLAGARFVLTPQGCSERQSGDEASLHLFVPEIARNSFCEEFTRFH
jgi:hypothetical protein